MTTPPAGAAAVARAGAPRPLGPGTLGRRLLTRVVALLAALAVVMGLVSTLFIHRTLVGALDQALADQARREFDVHGAGGNDRRSARTGRPVGSVTVVREPDGDVYATHIVDDVTAPVAVLSDDDLATLLALPADGQPRTVDLSIGHYRVLATAARPGGGNARSPQAGPAMVTTGLPLAGVRAQVWQVVAAETALALLVIATSVLVVGRLVRSALQPLHRLAGAASAVGRMELGRGDVQLPVRVPVGATDPSEVAGVSSAFNHMLDNVEDALTARHASETRVRQFVADASHELRNPLAAIRGYAELTRRDRDGLPADTAFAIGRIESESERMSALVEDMLLLARLDNQPVIHSADVDLTELVVMAVSDARAAGPHHVWKLDLPREPVHARGDRHRLHQVVVNLLTNARTHTPAGTVVTTSVRSLGAWVQIAVADDGPGIPAELQPRVFERFTRADASRARQGGSGSSTGLGLAIVRSVVEAHGGQVALDSHPGSTRFVLRLPATPDDTPRAS